MCLFLHLVGAQVGVKRDVVGDIEARNFHGDISGHIFSNGCFFFVVRVKIGVIHFLSVVSRKSCSQIFSMKFSGIYK